MTPPKVAIWEFFLQSRIMSKARGFVLFIGCIVDQAVGIFLTDLAGRNLLEQSACLVLFGFMIICTIAVP